MGIKVDQQTKEIEAGKLLALMRSSWEASDSAFAKAAGRTRAELKQHLTCDRPIPLGAAKAYAAVLKCSVRDISERWADQMSAQGGDNVPAKVVADFTSYLTSLHPDYADACLASVKADANKARGDHKERAEPDRDYRKVRVR